MQDAWQLEKQIEAALSAPALEEDRLQQLNTKVSASSSFFTMNVVHQNVIDFDRAVVDIC